jgi:A/G-specific adenine glycosylase
MQTAEFTKLLLDWYNSHGRHDLPWRQSLSPYRVWISEIMLQQTRVDTAIPYFNAFMKRFPNIKTLVSAPIDEVMYFWAGLGYYARARNLHRAASIIMDRYAGEFPGDIKDVMSLPGIGRSTAGAILAISKQQRQAILDGNVKRVLARFNAIEGWPGSTETNARLWEVAERYTPEYRVSNYTQAIMDLGAIVCTRKKPDCIHCPVQSGCQARKLSRQHDLPFPKPGKKLPVRKTVFAILENQAGDILLEHRPPTGIWGGLWGFPEFSPDQDITLWLDKQWGYTANKVAYKSTLRHNFSHFRLDITPVHVMINESNHTIQDNNHYFWCNPSDQSLIGMAKPVKKLMQEITNRNLEGNNG